MIINIEIILGFLESGKTNFINSMITNKEIQNEIILIIQNEFGCTELDSSNHPDNKIILLENEDEITEDYIYNCIKKYKPDRIFIETNGFSSPKDIINLFDCKNLSNICNINKIVNVIDAKRFSMQLKNMQSITSNHIYYSDTTIINNLEDNYSREVNSIKKSIESINETNTIYLHTTTKNQDFYKTIKQKYKSSILKDLLIIISIYFAALIIFKNNSSDTIYDNLFNFYKTFVGILTETIPFILIGSVLSSIIQICIPTNKIIKLFPKNAFVSCILASLLGILFPVCDCATISVVRGLIKKHLPVSTAVTFMLSSPIVNPIAILSTFIAFRGNISIVICRIISAIIISVLVGYFIHLSTRDSNNILLSDEINTTCNCTFCMQNYNYENKSISVKLKAIFEHAENEFFTIGKFMILGVFLSSVFQNSIFTDLNANYFTDGISKLIFMMALGFLLSVCSTSDAFIAKSFSNTFSNNSIMGFLVLGPMIDLKNTIMLFGTFKRQFVIKLIFFILVISFIVLKNLVIV